MAQLQVEDMDATSQFAPQPDFHAAPDDDLIDYDSDDAFANSHDQKVTTWDWPAQDAALDSGTSPHEGALNDASGSPPLEDAYGADALPTDAPSALQTKLETILPTASSATISTEMDANISAGDAGNDDLGEGIAPKSVAHANSASPSALSDSFEESRDAIHEIDYEVADNAYGAPTEGSRPRTTSDTTATFRQPAASEPSVDQYEIDWEVDEAETHDNEDRKDQGAAIAVDERTPEYVANADAGENSRQVPDAAPRGLFPVETNSKEPSDSALEQPDADPTRNDYEPGISGLEASDVQAGSASESRSAPQFFFEEPSHPITVQYRGEEFSLISASRDGFFPDASVLSASMKSLLEGFRAELANDIAPQDELVFQIDKLGLEFSESSSPETLSSVTMRQILHLLDVLDKPRSHEGAQFLYTYLFTKPNTIKRYEFLVSCATQDKNLDEIAHIFQPPFNGDIAGDSSSTNGHDEESGFDESISPEENADDDGFVDYQAGGQFAAEDEDGADDAEVHGDGQAAANADENRHDEDEDDNSGNDDDDDNDDHDNEAENDEHDSDPDNGRGNDIVMGEDVLELDDHQVARDDGFDEYELDPTGDDTLSDGKATHKVAADSDMDDDTLAAENHDVQDLGNEGTDGADAGEGIDYGAEERDGIGDDADADAIDYEIASSNADEERGGQPEDGRQSDQLYEDDIDFQEEEYVPSEGVAQSRQDVIGSDGPEAAQSASTSDQQYVSLTGENGTEGVSSNDGLTTKMAAEADEHEMAVAASDAVAKSPGFLEASEEIAEIDWRDDLVWSNVDDNTMDAGPAVAMKRARPDEPRAEDGNGAKRRRS